MRKHNWKAALLACALIFAGGCAGSEPASGNSGDGKVYTGEGTSMEGSYTVSVTLEGSDIKDVSVDAHY